MLFFLHLLGFCPVHRFPLAFYIWKAKAPSKIKAFICSLNLGRLNTNDMHQRCRLYKSLSSDVCVMCLKDSESHSHLFLHYSMGLAVVVLFI